MPFSEFVSPLGLPAAVAGFVLTLLLCVLVVLTRDWHGRFSMDFTQGIQKLHQTPTPRIGGLPIVLGCAAAALFAPESVQGLMLPILAAGMPAFLFGIAEDLTKRVSVTQRLLATMASGLLAAWLTGHWLVRVDLPLVDLLLQWPVVALVFTAFAVGGVANAINIIDGLNGLSSTTSVLAFMGYGLIAWVVGDLPLAGTCLILAACVWGFFWVNWPLGKLFLGDGGSYFIGFALAWVAVELLHRNPTVSAFAALLICAHPVTEVLFSVYRRKVRKEHPGMPDGLHFHSLVKRRYVARWLGHLPADLRNSAAGLMVGLNTLVPVLMCYWTYDSAWGSALALLAYALGYLGLYARMVRHHWCSPLSLLMPGSSETRQPPAGAR